MLTDAADKHEKYWHGFFIFAVSIKTFTGIVETISGLVIAFISPAGLGVILNKLSGGELLEDPTGFLVEYTNAALRHLTVGNKIFAGLYVLAHGLMNLFIVYGVLKNKPGAYLISIGILASFMLYQIPRYFMGHSPLLGILTIFDAVFIVLLYHEYKHLINKLAHHNEQS